VNERCHACSWSYRKPLIGDLGVHFDWSLTYTKAVERVVGCHSWAMKGLAISSEPSTGLTMVISGPLRTTRPSDRV
jgi:hypothetical protein